MDDQAKHSRRKVIKIGVTALAIAPLAGISEQAFATQNAAVRTALKFQDPEWRQEVQGLRELHSEQG
jgi:hypothetical protein